MKQFFKLHKVAVIVSAICLILALICGGFLACLLQSTIYPGVYAGPLSLSGLSEEEAIQSLEVYYKDAADTPLTLRCGDFTTEINLSDYAAQPEYAEIAKKAAEYGKDGGLFNKAKAYFSLLKEPQTIPVTMSCDEEALLSLFEEMAEKCNEEGREMQAELIDNTLTVTRGVRGRGVIVDEAMEQFLQNALTTEGKVYEVKISEIIPKEPNAKDLHEEFFAEPQDASYEIQNQRLVMTEDIPGVDFDITKAQSIIDATKGEVIEIPVTVVKAERTAETIRAELFPDLLGEYTTYYNAGDVNRSYNIRLACQNMHDTVLSPGDVFSYNNTVGPRTAARGFRTANVYVGNKVEPGIGGGICQASTTLFNAAVLSDLKIVTRTSHSMTVSYAPPGRDATVSYGSIDFKFENSTSHPVRIAASASGGANTIRIYGIKENKNRSISISTQNTSVTAPKVVQKEDPNLPEGTIEVEQKGSSGSTYNTYKVIYENGQLVKSEFLSKSTYVPVERIEIIGTAPIDTPADAPVDEPLENPADTPGTSPTDEPANTPEPTETAGPLPSESAVPVPIPVPAPVETPAPLPA